MFAALAFLPILQSAIQQPSLSIPEPGYTRPRNRVSGDKALRIMFLRTSFDNDADPTVSRHTEEELKKIGSDLGAFFKIQSYGALSVEKVEVTPVIKIGKSDIYEKTDAAGTAKPTKESRPVIADAIQAATKQLGRDLKTEFDMICVMINASPTKGRIAPTGVAALATGPQNSIFFGAKPGWRVFAHEIGHNFGFPHGWSVAAKAGDLTLAGIGKRVFTEYGDPMTPMGRGSNSYSVVEKYRMGWIGSSPNDVRYIKKFEPGAVSFMAYDQPDAKGLVGGYLEADFGVELRELVSKRDGSDSGGDAPTVAMPGPQRIWLSVVTRKNLIQESMVDTGNAILLAHLSSLVPPAKGGSKAFTTVSLDLKPAGPKKRREAMADRGLVPGESGTIQLKDGRQMTIKFAGFDSVTKLASIETSVISKP